MSCKKSGYNRDAKKGIIVKLEKERDVWYNPEEESLVRY
jgi:hypothetical protein